MASTTIVSRTTRPTVRHYLGMGLRAAALATAMHLTAAAAIVGVLTVLSRRRQRA
ncbi:MAG TPA: hypothetical protein VLA19_07835 [Herpetosiphonaceae bacterium]|nr:hypothetical protein [Herpetosiphonaceae bacterium]